MSAKNPSPLSMLKGVISTHAGGGNRGSDIAECIINAELLLSLAWHYNKRTHAHQAHLLLSNYQLFQTDTFNEQAHSFQQARLCLPKLRSSRVWHELLDAYMDDQLADYRQFDISEDDTIHIKDIVFGDFDRIPLYLTHLSTSRCEYTSTKPYAQAGKSYRYWFKPETPTPAGQTTPGSPVSDSWRTVTFPQHVLEQLQNNSAGAEIKPQRTRAPITFKLSELIEAAQALDLQLGTTHYARQIQKIANMQLLKDLRGSQPTATHELHINRVVNLAGMVGSGKSVLTDVVIYLCAQRGLRVVTVLNSISDVLETVTRFQRAGIQVSPLFSQRDRMKHLDNLTAKSHQLLLDDQLAAFLETPCILDGFAQQTGAPIAYGETPCFQLFETQLSRTRKHTSYRCPLYALCPSTIMQRKASHSQVIATTPAGFAKLSVGISQQPFFIEVLQNVDLVIFDEADRVQTQFDEIFAPKMSLQQFIQNTADTIAQNRKRPLEEKLIDRNLEYYYDLNSDIDKVVKALITAAARDEITSWTAIGDKSFTSFLLYEILQEEGLPDTLLDDLMHEINQRGRVDARQATTTDITLADVISLACDTTNNPLFEQMLDRYLLRKLANDSTQSETDCVLSSTLRERFAFALKVVSFDGFLLKLEKSYQSLSTPEQSLTEFYNFVRASCDQLDAYLPSSPVGNIFGFSISDDMYLFRHFATGRTLMSALPWLTTNTDGSPTGPHALMLSGSSYVPGCLRFHLTRPVDYLLMSTDEVSKFLAQTTVCDLALNTAVSGSGKNRQKHLHIVLQALSDTLMRELQSPQARKVLVIVNSYREAQPARDALQAALRERGCDEQVCALIRSESERDVKTGLCLPRSEVANFATHPARVLVAPALPIERGFNIVDADGNAVFDTLFFAVRPMGIPHNIQDRFKRMIGLLYQGVQTDAVDDSIERWVHTTGWKYWRQLERYELTPLYTHASIDDFYCRDIIASLMVLIVQIFGRLARVQDETRRPPRIYFADAAFAGNQDTYSFPTLALIHNYMDWLLSKSEQPFVAKALYGPFIDAFKKGIQHEAR